MDSSPRYCSTLIPRKHEEFAAPRATAFGQLPGEYDASMSSDGPRIAVVLNSKGTYGVLTQTIQDSEEKVSETIDLSLIHI